MSVYTESSNIRYTEKEIDADYEYNNVRVRRNSDGTITAIPVSTLITFRTKRRIPRIGCMMVGWGGNNGSTVTAAIIANKYGLTWQTKEGEMKANYFGSLTQASTVYIGVDEHGKDVYCPMKDTLPMVNPNDVVLDGWDISDLDLAAAMRRAKVIDINLQEQLEPYMREMRPRPSIFDPDFVASNQIERANNVMKETHKWQQIEKIRTDIRDFKSCNNLDKVIVFWTANTERYVRIEAGMNDNKENLMASIKANKKEISPSTLFAVASILEGCAYLNGAPQNTFVPGVIELAEDHQAFIGGDDLKSGQTKFKSVLVDFLVNAGIKPCSIVSYNHLGNNDGYNLSMPMQFKSKEISKSSVINDMVDSNQILYGQGLKHPDHCVVIKYVPYVGDSKRAMDEYTSELMLGGRNTIVVHNTCEDSLLAAPIILDLVILTELFQRVSFKVNDTKGGGQFKPFNAILSILAYLCKAPLVESGSNIVNALSKQRSCIENVMRALLSLPPVDHIHLQTKCQHKSLWIENMTRSFDDTRIVMAAEKKNNDLDGIEINRRSSERKPSHKN